MFRNIAALLVLGLAANSYAITIAENGQAKAQIVIRTDSLEPDQYAARELSNFLKQITGAEIPIVNQAKADTPSILLGFTWLAELSSIQVTQPKPEGIIILTRSNNLYLAGGGPRGTLYAVYTFLEDFVGCRWWASNARTIPSKPTLSFEQINYSYQPALEFRESFWTDAFDGDWAARNKCNGHTHRLEARHGGNHVYQGFVHTFYGLIPPDTYFKDHPEWFSMINNTRTHDQAQLCLTNEAMRQELVKNLKAQLRANPAATIASVSQNDCFGNCQCPVCAAIDQEEGSPAGSMIRFVNQVAADIETEFPRVIISTLAYQYTRKPPAITKPRANVSVQLCSIECSFSIPLADDRNQKFRDDLVGWSKICNRLYIWDYTTNFTHYLLPHPNLRVLAPNVKFFTGHNVVGIFEQGAYTSMGAEMAELRAWVLAKLLWNPSLDGNKLIDAFLAGYYGPAAPHIKSYLNVTHDAVEKSGDWLGCFSSDHAKFLTYDTLAGGWSHLLAAEAAVKDDPELTRRVQVAQLPVMYGFMRNWKEFKTQATASTIAWPLPETPKAVYDRFMTIAKEKNITRLNEWQDGFNLLDEALQNAEK